MFFFSKLVFTLTSAPGWPEKKHIAGYHFPMLYNFIVDMFKDPEGDIAERSAEELLKW